MLVKYVILHLFPFRVSLNKLSIRTDTSHSTAWIRTSEQAGLKIGVTLSLSQSTSGSPHMFSTFILLTMSDSDCFWVINRRGY
jgi:hypothetical protein